jgi:hypothetical protein
MTNHSEWFNDRRRRRTIEIGLEEPGLELLTMPLSIGAMPQG